MYGRPPKAFGSTNRAGNITLLPAPGAGHRYRLTHLWASPNAAGAFTFIELVTYDGLTSLIVWSPVWGGGGGSFGPASIIFPEPGLELSENAPLICWPQGAAIQYDIGGGYFNDPV